MRSAQCGLCLVQERCPPSRERRDGGLKNGHRLVKLPSFYFLPPLDLGGLQCRNSN